METLTEAIMFRVRRPETTAEIGMGAGYSLVSSAKINLKFTNFRRQKENNMNGLLTVDIN